MFSRQVAQATSVFPAYRVARMKILLRILAALSFLAIVSTAHAQSIFSYSANPSIANANTLFYCPQQTSSSVGTDYKCSSAAIAAYNYSLMSGDCTAGGTGAITCTKTNGTAFGGLATLTASTAGTIAYFNGTSWVILAGNTSGTQYLAESSSGVPSWSASSNGVSSLSWTCPTTNTQTGAVTFPNGIGWVTYSSAQTLTASQCGIWANVTGTTTISLPVIGVSGGQVENPYFVTIKNGNTNGDVVKVATTDSTNINYNGVNGTSITLNQGQSIGLVVTASGSIQWDATSNSANNYLTVTYAMSPYSYTPATGVKDIDVDCIAGGGGGGSGAVQATSTAASGGGGGGAASAVFGEFQTSALTFPVTVTIGAGGAGGAATTPSGGSAGAWTATVGNNGSPGGDTTFGTYLKAWHGGYGAGGQLGAASGGGGSGGASSGGGNASAGTGGTAGGTGGQAGGSGAGTGTSFVYGFGTGGGGSSSTGGSGGGGGAANGLGGGSGGGISSSNTASVGGNSGGGITLFGYMVSTGNPAVGTSGSSNASPININTGGYVGGTGGSGGGASVTAATAGGNGGGGQVGSGGGGGGAAQTTNTNATPGGAGGAGGNGACAIVERY